jgi:hypothetical protein
MPADLQKINEVKERIVGTMRLRGPSLPVHIARTINTSPIFASAFLSELYSEGRVKISNMKVGSSPLYFLPGQENLLENFIEYLNQREKEAFYLLKKDKILHDDAQQPVVRVALRAIRDFAVPIKINIGGEARAIWKYHLVPEVEFKSLAEQYFNPEAKKEIRAEVKSVVQKVEVPLIEQAQKVHEQIINVRQAVSEKPVQIEEKEEDSVVESEEESREIIIEKPLKKMKAKDFEFSNKIKEYLSKKDIELLSIVEEKKKDFSARIRIDIPFGKQEYFLVAKDKKKVSEIDLTMAHQRAQSEKLLALILSPGEPDKKALEYLKTWRNLVKFEKIRI